MSHREHGSYVKYVQDGCRCEPCRLANREYERQRASRIEPPYVSAGPARAHVEWLKSQGMGPKTIARASGVSHGAISKLLYGDYKGRGPSKRIRRETADKLLAVTTTRAADACKIDAAPTWARLNEMIGAGVPKAEIARALGTKGPGLQIRRDLVRAETERKVKELHAGWTAGTTQLYRRDRHGNTAAINPPQPPPVDANTARKRWNEIEPLLSELADILEERIDQPWRSQAACRGRRPDMWFPARGDAETGQAALKVCGACMVRDQCRAANYDQRDGIYGGLSAVARRNAREAA